MQRKIRIFLAVVCFSLISLLFLDFSGTVHPWLGWLARAQFVPAIIAGNLVQAGVIIFFTIVFGRIYCSVLCPLGVFQDLVSWVAGKKSKNRFPYSPHRKYLRYSTLAAFVMVMIAGFGGLAALIEPYSIFGRLAATLFSPLYRMGNNLLASGAAFVESYAFYSVNIWVSSIPALVVSFLTCIILVTLVWKNGRIFCNTLCPVGTTFGFLSKHSLFKFRINQEGCTHCGLCERNCKASCIDKESGKIDHARCVACFNCLESCPKGVIEYSSKSQDGSARSIANSEASGDGSSRRKFLAMSSLFVIGTAKEALAKKFDGGFAIIEDMKPPERSTHLVPPGAMGIAHFTKHCTGCLLCVSACPNNVLRPSSNPERFMQPEMSFERGYCRPECTRCSEVCPNGAIVKVSAVEKSATQIGHAIWKKDLCVINKDKKSCNNCARHCPTGAIKMVPQDSSNDASLKIPIIDEGRCTGCGACETLCPARPYSAIYIEGHEHHGTI